MTSTFNQQLSTDVAVATQHVDIERLRDDLSKDEQTIKDDRKDLRDLENAVAGLQGEERGIGALLLLIQVFTFVFQTRKEKNTK